MTNKQRNLARITAEKINAGEPLPSKGKLVELGGYGIVVQKTPGKVLDTVGYKKALAEYGLTEQLVTLALVEDIKKKKGNRVGELKLAAEILNMKNQDEGSKTPVINVINFNDYDPSQLRPNAKTVPVESVTRPVEVQVSDYSPESR